ncbi:M15 family metallopeptidase, partial [Bradyrhizobium sp. 31Argb]|uniref:M15 family metallopeptidase n=1 Tax=Bradyrhizobium sp. 31Argb TaxID=3141247 RepID=UPI0037482190
GWQAPEPRACDASRSPRKARRVCAPYPIRSIGGYNHRTIAGSNRLSQHAFGNAIDINPGANPMQHGLRTDMPANISEMAAKHGLSWGGDWKGRKDPMHFEWTGKTPSAPKVAETSE